jgi:hypothetical protein
MITNYPIDTDAENVIFNTIYEDFESSIIKRSECHCKKENKITTPDAKCYFYDSSDNEIGCINLPNSSAYSIYQYRKGIILNCDEKSIILSSSGPPCYSIETGEILWCGSVKITGYVFPYKGKIYTGWLTCSKGGLVTLDSSNGVLLEEKLTYTTKLLHPSFHRLNEDNILIHIWGYIFIYELSTEKLLLSKKLYIDEPVEWFRMLRIENNNNEVAFEHGEFFYHGITVCRDKRDEKEKNGWFFTDTTEKIADLLEGALPCNLTRIPTTQFTLQRIYKKLFNVNPELLQKS